MVDVEVVLLLFGIASEEAGARRSRGFEAVVMMELAEGVRAGPLELSSVGQEA